MDLIKEAFQKIKEEMISLKQDINLLKLTLMELNQEITNINQKLATESHSLGDKPTPTIPTHPSINSAFPTQIPTHHPTLDALRGLKTGTSTGNEGVPTDKQTDKQTDQHMIFNQEFEKNSIEQASEILSSLDNIKKEIRLKFKRLTEQEILVFSTLYQLEDEYGYADYKSISNKLKLSESSIRDYIGKIIKKGIPVDKKRINNKNIQLSISSNLKKITSLDTILKLRDI
ncbi:MAG: hypothetical protein KKA64_02535 [Nanoarchaeota archaeon]|nr:hypothetical protein [Nanoarchaeota archaeon]